MPSRAERAWKRYTDAVGPVVRPAAVAIVRGRVLDAIGWWTTADAGLGDRARSGPGAGDGSGSGGRRSRPRIAIGPELTHPDRVLQPVA